MDGFGSDHYVPVLLTKQGERGALGDTPAQVKAAITPLFVVAPIDWDFDTDTPRKDISSHLDGLPEQLVAAWGTQEAFVDLAFTDDDLMPDGRHPLVWIVEQAAGLGLRLVPTIVPNRTPAYSQAVATTVRNFSNEVCVRLPIDQWPTTTGTADLEALMIELGLRPPQIHLVLDLGDEVGAAAQALAIAELRALPWVSEWRSLTLAGAGMPQTSPAGSGLHVLSRPEWSIYESIRTARVPVPRVPTFSDYGIAHPNPITDVDPKLMSISAQLRYTTADAWLIAKGGLFKGSGGRSQGGLAVPPAARLLTDHPEYMGSGHCRFEGWLEAVCDGSKNGGNASTWRRYATHHHFHVVTDQVASVFGS